MLMRLMRPRAWTRLGPTPSGALRQLRKRSIGRRDRRPICCHKTVYPAKKLAEFGSALARACAKPFQYKSYFSNVIARPERAQIAFLNQDLRPEPPAYARGNALPCGRGIAIMDIKDEFYNSPRRHGQ